MALTNSVASSYRRSTKQLLRLRPLDIVFDKSKSKPFQDLFDGELGRNYSKSSTIHDDMLIRLEKAKSLFSEL